MESVAVVHLGIRCPVLLAQSASAGCRCGQRWWSAIVHTALGGGRSPVRSPHNRRMAGWPDKLSRTVGFRRTALMIVRASHSFLVGARGVSVGAVSGAMGGEPGR